MMLNDPIYGKTEITEPILSELINSPLLQRLKKLSQYGIPDKYYHLKGYSRFEHSLGVMILLRRLGATLEEQIAGLIHDISHLAFSHVADWVFADGEKRDSNENLQDTLLESFLSGKKVLKIFKKYNLSLERLSREENFSLLEKPTPDLCADRVDYALREFKYWLNPKIVETILKNIINFNGEIAFLDKEVAFAFASNFLELQTQHWGGFESTIRYHFFSQILKKAIEKKIIIKNDFYKDDVYITQKIEKFNEEEINKVLLVLKQKKLAKMDFLAGEKIYKKFRYVDPKIIVGAKLEKLSIVNPKFNKEIEKHRKINEKGFCI